MQQGLEFKRSLRYPRVNLYVHPTIILWILGAMKQIAMEMHNVPKEDQGCGRNLKNAANDGCWPCSTFHLHKH